MTTDGLKPLFEWRMTPDSGEIEEIERDQENTSEKVVVLNIDPKTLKTESESYDQALKDLVIPTTLPQSTSNATLPATSESNQQPESK
jgi:hypothetical protein